MKKFWLKNKERIILAVILLLAFILRVLGIIWGLPNFHFHVDENFVVAEAFRIRETHEFITPDHVPAALFYRLLTTLYSIYLLFNQAPFLQLEETSRNIMILIGRFISVVFGTLTVYLIYKIGKEIFNKKIGLLAAFLLSFTFVHVVKSHYVKYDITATFWGLTSFLYAFYILKTREPKNYLLAGFFIGLAASTHFLYFFFLIPALAAHLLLFKKGKGFKFQKIISSKLFLLFLWLAIAFFVVNPYLFFKPQDFLRAVGLTREAIEPTQSMLSKGNIPTPLWYLFYLSSSGLYYPMFLTTVLGIYILVRRRKKKDILFLSFPLVYLAFLFFNSYRNDRLTLPLMPFFALYSAVFLEEGWRKVKRMKIAALLKNIILLGSILIIFVIPLARTTLFSYLISQKDTRQRAAEWIEKNYSKGQTIFAAGDTIHIGHFLQEKGFSEVISPVPLENKEVFLFEGEVFLIDSVDYHIAQNYKNIEEYKNFWENYQLVKEKGRLIKEFSQPLFKAEFFSPAFLEVSSTVNAYHNPTVEIYEIPKLDEYANGPVSFEYLPEEMSHNMQLLEKNGEKFLFKESENQKIITGPHKLFPKGDYLLDYFILSTRCYLQDAIVTLQANPSGQTRYFAQNKFPCTSLGEHDKLRLRFRLEKPTRLELVLEAKEGISFFIEKALLKRTNYD